MIEGFVLQVMLNRLEVLEKELKELKELHNTNCKNCSDFGPLGVEGEINRKVPCDWGICYNKLSEKYLEVMTPNERCKTIEHRRNL